MELVTILIMSIIILIVLVILLKFNKTNIQKIKDIGESKELNEITNALPENEEICKDILKMLKNENVTIKDCKDEKQASLFIVVSNAILISNKKSSFTRVQTVAHECIHSIQDKRLLWFNFIFSNIYIFYFAIITILTVFKVIKCSSVFSIILVMMSILLYFVRSYLETDAMIKARYIAQDYLQKKSNLVNEENCELIIKKYDEINSIGIKYYNFSLLLGYLTKVIVYCIISIVMFMR